MAKPYDKFAKQRAAQETGQKMGAIAATTRKKGGSVKKVKSVKKK